MIVSFHNLPSDDLSGIQFGRSDFICLIVLERPASEAFRNEVSDALVLSGCAQVSAWGEECELWDDSVDWAETEFSENKPSNSILTTWHDGETLQETLEFVSNGGASGTTELVVLHFGLKERAPKIEAVVASTLASRQLGTSKH